MVKTLQSIFSIYSILILQLFLLKPITSTFTNCLDSNCSLCNSNSCVQCKTGYSLNTIGGCWKCGTGCAECNNSQIYCSVCRDGSCFIANYQTFTNCKDYNCLKCSSSQCVTCREGYSLNNIGGCWSCPQGCFNCLSSPSQCTTCFKGNTLCTGTSGNTGGNTSTTDNSVAVAIACGIVIPVVVIAIIIIIVCCLKKKAELELEQESNNVAVSGGAVSVVKPIGADDYANNMLNNNQGHSSGVSGGNMNLNANTHVNANVNASNSGHYAYTQYQPNNNKVDGTKTMSYGYDGNTDNVNVGVDYNAPIPSNAAYLGYENTNAPYGTTGVVDINANYNPNINAKVKVDANVQLPSLDEIYK